MDNGQKGFIVYGDIKATADELTDDQLGQLFRGMIDYFVQGECPRFTDSLKFAFVPIKQQMDRDADKYVKKCEKMRSNANKRWSGNAIASKSIQLDANDANTNTNKDTNTKTDTDTNTMSAETDAESLAIFLLDYLNEKAGTRYIVGNPELKRVQSLLDAGYTGNQMRTVIDRKCDEWLTDEKMRTYLRPSTLFGDKFSEYLSAPISLMTERKQDEAKKKKSLEKELSEKRQSLEVMRSSLEEIPRGTRMDERRALKEQIAQLEDSIGLIEGRLS